MILDISRTKMEGVRLIKLSAFEDFRGSYTELYSEKEYKEKGVDIHFIEDDISVSTRHVLRGIHGDDITWKLVSCLHGKFYLVVVNCDTGSANFGQWEAFTLSDRNWLQVLVPPKHGNAHLVLSDVAIFSYKQSQYYDRSRQFTYKWNDPEFGIFWPISEPILSLRDIEGR